ncbi:MAG TPA: amino acid transporter protein [Beijerinckiaceae bacterium]|jgi:hypothetical protein
MRDAEPGYMSLVENEQAKLTATYLNGIAVAIAAVGGIAPGVAFLVQDTGPGAARVTFISLVCLSVSGVLHYAARRVLRRLREP